jgi:phage nucleotide-binding protein
LLAPKTTLDSTKLAGFKLVKASETVDFLNILFYGESGVGKTILAASADAVAAMSPVLLIDFEAGTWSIKDKYPNVDILRPSKWDDLGTVWDTIRQNPSRWRTIVIDSITEMQKFNMSGIMKKLVIDKPDRDPDVSGLQEYLKSGEQVRRFVRAMRDLPVNVIFTALDAADEDQQTHIRRTTPDLPGKLKGQVAGFLDIVGYYYKKRVGDEIKRCLLVTGTDKQIAKDRSDKLPPVMVDPTMTEIHKTIFGTTEKEN